MPEPAESGFSKYAISGIDNAAGAARRKLPVAICDSETGLNYLRARYSDPGTGQFMSRDPMVAVTKEPFAYTGDNPLNATDPLGLFGWDDVWNGAVNAAKTVLHIALDVAAVPPYAAYYASYEEMKAINNWGQPHGGAWNVAAHAVTAPLFVPEALGLWGDEAIDWTKGHTVNNESTCDEGVVGYINPLHDYVPSWLKGPKTYLPGVHANGYTDWE